MRNIIVIFVLLFVGCTSTNMEVVKNQNRCEGKVYQGPITEEYNELYTPIVRVVPNYPIEAARDGLDGYVIMALDISADGIPENIEVVESFPEDVFVEEAVKALSKWRYKPRVVGGKTVNSVCKLVELKFKLKIRD